ncbi:MAG: hypothetical protein J5950_04400 [Clostridia bacterium]|nr:hypothetical protein [Clostridia bacterium]
MAQQFYLIVSLAAGALAAALAGCVFGIMRAIKARGIERWAMLTGAVELILGAVYPAYVIVILLSNRTLFLESTLFIADTNTKATILVTVLCILLAAFCIVCLCSIRKKGAAKNIFCVSLAAFSILTPYPIIQFMYYFGAWNIINNLPLEFLRTTLGLDADWSAGRALIMLWIILLVLAGITFIVLGIIAMVMRLTEKRDIPLRIGAIIVSLALLPITVYSSVIWAGKYATHQFYPPMQYKPVLYFFPETETEVSVKLGYPELLTVTYPDYPADDGWTFTASPDGTLTLDGKQYPYMYFEAECGAACPDPSFSDKGFVVAREDTAAFLEAALVAMGFDFKERADFITFWLPLMSENSYNRVEFLFGDDVNALMPVAVSPAPDNTLQVYMLFAACDPSIADELTTQEFPTFVREGFAMLEWGGICLR